MQNLFMLVAAVSFMIAGGTYFDRGSERRAMRLRGISIMVAGFFIILSVAARTIPMH